MAKDKEVNEELAMTAEELAATRQVGVAHHAAAEVAESAERAVMVKVAKVFGADLQPVTLDLDSDGSGLDVTDFEYLDLEAVDAGEVLDEYELVPESELVGVPFFIVGAHLNDTDLTNDGYYYNVRCVTIDKRKVCFNDGGTGVYVQLKRILNAQPEPRPIRVKGGLRVSTFHVNKDGVITEGTPNAATYYLSSSLTASQKTKALLSALQR